MNTHRRRKLRLTGLFLSPFALAACQGEEKTAEAAPQGEVLPASVSDAMLPLDTVRSQPPFAPQTEAASGSATGAGRGSAAEPGDDDEEEGEDAPTEAPPAAAPSVTPDTAP